MTGCTPHRTEELLSLVSFVVPLPAHFTVEPGFALVTYEAPECFLLHTALGTVNVLIRFTVFTALWEGFFCAHTSCNGTTNHHIIISPEAEEELLDLLRITVSFITLFNSSYDIWSAEFGVCFR